MQKLSRELDHACAVASKQESNFQLLLKKSKKDIDAGARPLCLCAAGWCLLLSASAHLTLPPPRCLAAREHSASLNSKLQEKQEQLEKLEAANAKLADAAAQANEREKAAAAAQLASLDALRGEADAAAAAAADAHAKALAAAQAARDEATQAAADVARDARASLQNLEKERDDALQVIGKLQGERETLVAAAERAAGLQLSVDDLNNELVRAFRFIIVSRPQSFGARARRRRADALPIGADGEECAGRAAPGGTRQSARCSRGCGGGGRCCRRGASSFILVAMR